MMQSAHELITPLRYSTRTFAHVFVFSLAAILLLGLVAVDASASTLPSSPEIQKYLVIGTGEESSSNDFVSFDMSNVEIGADQELVSNSSVGAPSQRVGSYAGGLDLTGTWVPNDGANAAPSGNRYNDVDPDHSGDTVGVPDVLPGARPVFEGIDYSGNVALTGSRATFMSSDSDVNADIGIQCNRTPGACFPQPSSVNSYFESSAPNTAQDLNALAGISMFNPTNLIGELAAMRDFIVGLPADTTFNSGFTNVNIKDSGAPQTTDLDAIDAAGTQDGFAVIDIAVGGTAFSLNNTDWILQSTMDTLAILRMKTGTQFNFSNSSILLGDGTTSSTDVIEDLGAIFFMDAFQGTNELFANSNVILGGIGLWDFTDFNPNRSVLLSDATSSYDPPNGDATVINLQDAQGCAQFISHQVLMSNNRWNHCAQVIPEPTAVALWTWACLAVTFWRRGSLQRSRKWHAR